MKILMRQERSLPNAAKPLIKEGKEIIWDNVNLYVADLDRYGAGLLIPSDRSRMVVKIRTEDFQAVTGYTYDEFVQLFEDNFFGHDVSVWGEQDMYGKFVPKKVEIGNTCYINYTAEASKFFADNRERRNTSANGDLIPF